MVKTALEGEDRETEELLLSLVSDLSKIALLAEFIEDAIREKCDCRVCRKLKERGKSFIISARQSLKM